MPTYPMFAKTASNTLAAALVALLAASPGAFAQTLKHANPSPPPAPHGLKLPSKGPGVPLAGARRLAPNTGANPQAYGCHDHQSQTSYEGPCDQYDIKGSGCESSAEQASVPGNCPNSSEP